MNKDISIRVVRRPQLDRERLVRALVEAARLKHKIEVDRQATPPEQTEPAV
jgi:hypothetical protein